MAVLIFKDMSKKKKNNQLNDVVKALRRAERELQLERNGYDHPWVAMTITYKNKKAYDRKRDRKNFKYDSDGLSFFLFNIIFTLNQQNHMICVRLCHHI